MGLWFDLIGIKGLTNNKSLFYLRSTVDARKLAFNFTPRYKSSMKKYTEENGLGTSQVPAGYGAPDFSVGDGTNPGPNPDATLAADTAAAMSAGEENPGFSLGGANDPLNEYEAAGELSGQLVGNPDTTPLKTPNIPQSVQENDDAIMHEDDIAFDAQGNVVDDFTNPVQEDDDVITFDTVDEMPEFEEYDETDVVDAEVDGAGVIEPEVIDIDIEDPELGAVPDVELPMTEPIVQVEEGEPDVYATEAEIEGTEPEPIVVTESFRLPEDRSVVVAKGDQIFVIGHAMNENSPKFTESVFKRAFRSLVESKNVKGKLTFKKSEGMKKCALVGRSLLLEVAKDWRIPGTDLVLEAHDIVQIVSMKPVCEKTVAKKEEEPAKNQDDSNQSEEETEEEKKAKKEMFLAQKRYMEAKARREAAAKKENDPEDKGDEAGKEEPKTDKDDDNKKTEAFLRKNGIYF